MVERPRLLIGPWQVGEHGNVRPISDPAAGIQVGSVRHTSSPWWKVWSPGEGFQICETDDAALLISVVPSKLGGDVWIVRDCDGNPLGRIRGDELLDPWGEAFARCQRVDERLEFREWGEEIRYATWTRDGDKDLIQFAEHEVTNPFLRLLVLGMVIVRQGHSPLSPSAPR